MERKKKRKGPKGPNPLSVKKKTKTSALAKSAPKKAQKVYKDGEQPVKKENVRDLQGVARDVVNASASAVKKRRRRKKAPTVAETLAASTAASIAE